MFPWRRLSPYALGAVPLLMAGVSCILNPQPEPPDLAEDPTAFPYLDASAERPSDGRGAGGSAGAAGVPSEDGGRIGAVDASAADASADAPSVQSDALASDGGTDGAADADAGSESSSTPPADSGVPESAGPVEDGG